MYTVWTVPYFVKNSVKKDFFGALQKIIRSYCKKLLIRWLKGAKLKEQNLQ